MENLYNAVLTFKGEGSFTFALPKYGELTIYRGRDIYVKGLTVSAVESLRQLRPLMLEHKLNAKSDGCYKVIDLTSMSAPIQPFQRAYQPKATEPSVADLKSQLIKSEGPIPTEEEEKEPKIKEIEIDTTKITEVVDSSDNVKTDEPSIEAPKATKTTRRNTRAKGSRKNTKKK